VFHVGPSAGGQMCRHEPTGTSLAMWQKRKEAGGAGAHGRVQVGQVRLVGAVPLDETHHHAVVEGAPRVSGQ
jgi:hypothetical protein